MLTQLISLIAVAFICLLFTVAPVIGAIGHACDDGHEASSAASGGDHDNCRCGCLCHTAEFAVLPDMHDAHSLPKALAQHDHITSTYHTFLPSIKRPPRTYS